MIDFYKFERTFLPHSESPKRDSEYSNPSELDWAGLMRDADDDQRFKKSTLNLADTWRFLGKILVVFCLVVGTGAMVDVYAQEVQLTGKVTDGVNGEGLPGVNILVKGTGTGAVTDYEGNYTLKTQTGATLLFSFVGYVSEEMVVGSQSAINMALMPDITTLGELVVIGYGAVKKKDLTGVVALVEAKNFNKGIISSPDKLLTGKVAGLQISSGGDPGGSTSIRIRGASINGETPLFVVDGIPLPPSGVTGGRNPLNFMNPADVESVTVLKDASAAAIYGSRGANGVIIITTKSGEAGKMKISYDGFFSISQFTKKVDILSPSLYRDAIFSKAPQEFEFLGDANTKWVDEVLQVAQGHNHNLSVSGGNKSTTYFASFNYQDSKGVMRYTRNQNTSFSLKLSQKLFNDNLTIRLNSKNGFTKDQFSQNVMGAALRFDPTRPVFDDSNTEFGGYFQWAGSNTVSNPVATQDLNDERGSTFRTLNNLELDYKLPFADGLSFKVNLGYDSNEGEYARKIEALEKGNVINDRGVITRKEDNKKTSLLSEYYFNYKRDVAFMDGKIEAIAGYSWQNFRTDFTQLAGNNSELIDGEWVPTDITENKPEPVENRLISFFGRVNFDIKGKYLFTTSLRKDGSTRFGDSNKWGLFPGAAFAWRIIDEDFASGWGSIFSDLKFRVGYGLTGNQEIPNYRYNVFYKFSQDDASYQFGDDYVNTLRPKGVDPDIKWEETTSINVGVDAAMYDGRLNFSIEYYIKNVNDLLYEVAVPAGSNLSDRVLTNIAKVQNKGIELTIDGVLFDRDRFDWDLGFNIATNSNEVLKIDNNVDPSFGGYEVGGISGDVGQTIQVLKVGEPINAFRTYRHKLDESGNPISSDAAIDMYEDINEDGLINEKDLVIDKQPTPRMSLGLTSNMRYKSFDLSFTVRGSFGNYVYNNTSSSAGYFDLLTEKVTNNIHTSAFKTNFKTRQLKSDYYIENASFLNLDNITLGYTFDKVKFARIKAYVTAQNILTLTGYSGLDPEVFSGIDNNQYPRSTTFIVGVNANF